MPDKNVVQLMQEVIGEDIKIMQELIKEEIEPLLKYRAEMEKKAFEKAYRELKQLEEEV